MLNAIGHTKDGEPILILGLSGENITRLIADKPIKVELAGIHLVLFYGKKDADLMQNLSKLIAFEKQHDPHA